MSSKPWHRRYHSDALAGFLALTLEERGAYQTLLDLMYDRGGPIPDNERLLSGYMGCSLRKWRALREQLLLKRKINVIDDGRLSNSRFEKELENDAKTRRKHAENGSKGGRNKAENAKNGNENNEGDEAGLGDGSSLPEARGHMPEEAKASSAREPDIDVPSLMNRLCSAAGIMAPDPGCNFDRHTEALSLVEGWITAGADPDKLEQCVAARAASAKQTPRSLRYFDGAVRDAIAASAATSTEADRLMAQIRERKGIA